MLDEESLCSKTEQLSQSIDKFCARYSSLHQIPPDQALTVNQQLALVQELQFAGFDLYDGHLDIPFSLGRGQHERMLRIASPLPAAFPPPLEANETEANIHLRYNIPFSTKRQDDCIYTPADLRTERGYKKATYEFVQIDKPCMLSIESDAVVASIKLNSERKYSIAVQENARLQLKAIEAETDAVPLYLSLKKGSTLIIPDGDPSLLQATIMATAANIIFVDQTGMYWAIENLTCKEVTLAQALAGYQETQEAETQRPILTKEAYQSLYSPEALIKQMEKKAEHLPDELRKLTIHGEDIALLGSLGKGGKYSVAYLAFSYDLHKQPLVVLKVENSDLSEEERKIFASELHTLYLLEKAQRDLDLTVDSQPLTPQPMTEKVLPDGRRVIVMSLAVGASLEELTPYYKLNLDDTLTVIDHLTRVLEALHSLGLTYHDFQPQVNVFWNPQTRRATVIDFNLLKRIAVGDLQPIRSDIKVVGLLLFKLAAGLKFTTIHQDRIQANIQTFIPMIGNLQEIITKAMNGDYNSIQALRLDIENLQRDHPQEVANYIPEPTEKALSPLPLERKLVATPATLKIEEHIKEIHLQIDATQAKMALLESEIESADSKARDENIDSTSSIQEAKSMMQLVGDDIAREIANIDNYRRGALAKKEKEQAKVLEKLAQQAAERLAKFEKERDDIQSLITNLEEAAANARRVPVELKQQKLTLIFEINEAQALIHQLQNSVEKKLQQARKKYAKKQLTQRRKFLGRFFGR